jgi:hypothetical protein
VTQHPRGENFDPAESTADSPAADEATDAALDAVEPDRLLPGEDQDSVHLDDAEHWASVYAELLDFKRSLLQVAENRLASMRDAARTEVEETDLKVLQAEAQRLTRRFEFWQTREGRLRARAT